MRIKEVLGNLLFCIIIVAMWVLYAYFIVMPVMNVPIWTVGGILTLLGAIALAIAIAVISVLLVIAILS